MRRPSLVFMMITCLTGCTKPSPSTITSSSTDMADLQDEGTTQVDAATLNNDQGPPADTKVIFSADVWADNWFAMYVGDVLVAEDSVPITTERSFNAESFTFKAAYPLRINIIAKDFKENDSGLEYIGERNQQMGDGGLIVQIKESSSGDLVVVTDERWKCLPIHRAPLNKECERSSDPINDCQSEIMAEPTGWKDISFDTSSWPQAVVHAEQDVSPKDGYDLISWASKAKFIWGADLETDNTLLCTITLEAP